MPPLKHLPGQTGKCLRISRGCVGVKGRRWLRCRTYTKITCAVDCNDTVITKVGPRLQVVPGVRGQFLEGGLINAVVMEQGKVHREEEEEEGLFLSATMLAG